MNDDSQKHLPVELLNQADPYRTSVEAETRQQVEQLKTDANNMLMQLMLEQKSKLNEMVQQLQNQGRSPENNCGGDPAEATDASSDKTAETDSDVAEEPPESHVPVNEVTKLQEQNMLHLDVVLQRINATMESCLPDVAAANESAIGEEPNDTSNTDI